MPKTRKLVEEISPHSESNEGTEHFSPEINPTLSPFYTANIYIEGICRLFSRNLVREVDISVILMRPEIKVYSTNIQESVSHPDYKSTGLIVDYFMMRSGLMQKGVTAGEGYFLIDNSLKIRVRLIVRAKSIVILKLSMGEEDSNYYRNYGNKYGKTTPGMSEEKLDKDSLRLGGIADRFRLLEELTGSPVARYVRDLFPEIVELERAEAEGRTSWASRVEEKGLAQEPERPPLPEKAPALWAEAKERGDTPPAFIRRHYAPWLGKGLTRANLRHLDPQLEMALRNWLRKNELPEGLNLPTKSEQLAADARQLASPDSPEATAVRRLAYRLDKERTRTR